MGGWASGRFNGKHLMHQGHHTIGGGSKIGRFHITQMPVPFQLLSLLVLLTACESDLDKLQRLDTERWIQCLNAEAEYEALQKARPDPRKRTPQTDTLAAKWIERQAKCELATRDYERFRR